MLDVRSRRLEVGKVVITTNETKTLLKFSRDLNYINEKQYKETKEQYEVLSKMIYSIIKKWN